ncbi:ABC transporter substrate-binding protein [Microbacterium aurantiacum]|uniref:ABC transporter substrate-binding protein n=1 Tax=Microbacterium aurantiacum TaxID=162393 RepID=A0ABT8FQ05_9MICO|nr:ABC transporter substrate-binding protein [Microbacterium aurantiacum]MDN4463404.1 ABC transporter substrate-binding protein [Microbacterium aurantiacum]
MTRLRPVLALAAATTLALSLAGCASAAEESDTTAPAAGDSAAFPLTIPSALGDAVLESAPERVATWGWGATDAVLALGVVPVAIPSDDYSGGESRISPWIEDALEEMDAETPVILDNSAYELQVEELLAADPDVLIAPYSGLTQEEFDAVTGAGIPVVAYPEAPWTTPWRDVVTITGEALGLEAEADEVLESLDAEVAAAAAAHPEFEGVSISVPSDSAGTWYLYLPADPRVEILEDLGFVTPPSVTDLDTGESTFYTTVSPENLDQVDSEVVLTFVDSEEALEGLLGSSTAQLMPAVAQGAVAGLVGVEEISALTPTPLTLPWILPTLTEKLAAATAVAQG